MHALVLAVCPSTLTGYAVVHGSRVHESGVWALAAEIRTSGPAFTPQEVVIRLMERRLTDEVEHVALRYELDAIVIERDAGHHLHAAAERGALLAKRSYRLIEPDAWRSAAAAAHRDPGSEPTSSTSERSEGCPDAPGARDAVALGRHGSSGMGIWPLHALPDGGEWA